MILSLVGCTQPGETTAVSAATGGAMGAGVGAIVGNQTGSTAGGMVVGAVTGASAGALVGNALEAQEQEGYRRDEAIERQEQMLRAQRGQIAELRRLSQDSVQFKGSSQSSRGGATPTKSMASLGQKPAVAGVRGDQIASRSAKNTTTRSTSSGGVSERTIVSQPDPVSQRSPQGYGEAGSRASVAPSAVKQPQIEQEVPSPSFVEVPATPSQNQQVEQSQAPADLDVNQRGQGVGAVGSEESSEVFAIKQPDSAECEEAREEFKQSNALQENSDKLFHLRRALRLCPEDPIIQNAMGELYLSLGRVDDAQYQFQEALRIEPNYQVARQNLSNISKGDRY